jgi:tRNA(Ile2) C34 agmatinyltransferase TiaS
MPAYLGQIMAECDCESQLCLGLGRCMTEDPPRCQSCEITMEQGPGKMTKCWKCPQCGRSIER